MASHPRSDGEPPDEGTAPTPGSLAHPQAASSSQGAAVASDNPLNLSDTQSADLSADPDTVPPNQQTGRGLSNTTESSLRSTLQRTGTNNEPRKCWICFADETEDTPTSSTWKSPCPCALTAHEACILDWVADLEAPPRGQRAPRKIECPQCKGEIHIARPRSPLADGVRRVDRALSRLTLPGIALTLIGSITAGAWVHGLVSIYVVFGPDDFATLFRVDSRGGLSMGSALAASLVPFALVASRTRAADTVLPVIPVLFFATQYPERRRGGAIWPPTPAMAFVSLPYIRGLYNLAWQHFAAAEERQWISEVNPRAAQQEQRQGNIEIGWNVVRQRRDEPQQPAVEVQVLPADHAQEAVGGHEAHGDPAAVPDAQAGGGVPPAAADDAAGNGDGHVRDGAANNNNVPNGAIENANTLIDTGGRIADAIMGALCFPFVAAAAGELLRLALPIRWVVVPARNGGGALAGGFGMRGSGPASPITGLLQARWGRSIVGGCLFVVLKDTLRLYARYRMAVGQRSRHVLDFEGAGGKGRREGGDARG